MADRIKELEGDIDEFQKLLLDAERPNVQNYLAKHISSLKTKLEELISIKIEQEPKKTEAPIPPPSTDKIIDKSTFIPLTKYGWDQEGAKVRIIIGLQGVGSQCTKEQVEMIFTGWSVEMRLNGYRQQNYIFAIKKLFGEIKSAESKFILKANEIRIILIKKENKNWDQIQFKEDKFGLGKEKEKEKEEKEDPSAGIMNMMKKMYEQGDENMKRTIAEAWSKANDKKGEKHDFSDRYDFLNK